MTDDVFQQAQSIEESRDVFTPFSIQGTGNDFSDKALATQLTAVSSFVEAREVGLQFYDRAKNDVMDAPDLDSLVRTELEKYRGSRIQEVIEAASPVNTVESAERIETLNEDMRKPDALQSAYIQAITRADTLVTKNEISNQFLAQKMQEIMGQETGLLETIGNYAALLIPDTPFDVADATGGSIFNFSDDWNKILTGFKSLTPEEKVLIAEPLFKGLMEAFDNNSVKAMAAAQDFFNPGEFSAVQVSGALDTFDLITFPLTLMTKTLRGVGLIKAAKKVNNPSLAGKINAEATVDRKAAEAGGVDHHTAQMNTSGFAMEKLEPRMTDGIAAESVKSLEKRLNAVETELADVNLEGASLATPTERVAGKKAFFDDYAERLKNIEEQRNIVIKSEPRFVEDTLEGFNVEVTIGDGSSIVVPIRFQKGDLGAFEGSASTGKLSALASPSVFLKNLGNNLVNTATRLGFKESKNVEAVSKAYAAATKGIKEEGLARVDNVLLHGDGKARVYTMTELMDEGVITATGRVRLSQKEAESYFSTRKIFDWLHMQKNGEIRRQLEFEGFGYLRTEGVGGLMNGEGVFAKRVNKAELDDLKEVLDFDTKMIVAPNATIADKLKSDLYSLVAFKDAVRVEDADGAVRYISRAVVKKDALEGLPAQVLNYHAGYVPLMRKNTQWVARRTVSRIVDGVDRKALRTEGFFESQTEAKAWAAKQTDADDVIITRDRELPEGEKAEADILQFGSLFGSARSKRKLFQGVNEGDTTRINAFEALERNLAHVANSSTMNEFRLNLIEKFKKTAGQHLTSSHWQSPVKQGTAIKTKDSIERTREWIKEQLRIPSEAERRFEGRMNAVADAMDGNVKLDGVRKAVIDFGQTDPVGLVRSASFHVLLGALNPSQLLVQAQNASMAFSLAPLRAPKLIAQYKSLHAGMLVKHSDKALRLIAKRTGQDADEYVKLIKDFNGTGLFQSVKTNADFAAASDGFKIDKGAVKRAIDNSLIFFREGEMFGRGYAWLLARDDFLKANKGRKIGGPEIAEITDKSLAFTMNMNRANRAQWQKGWLSIPTQFFQVTAKFTENMLGLGTTLTGVERAKIMVGQLALYGATGVPIGGAWLVNSLLDSMGVNYGELDPTTQAAARGGAWEMAFEIAFGVRIQSNRFAVASGITEMIKTLTDEKSSLLETLSGAFGTVPHRGFQAISKLSVVTADVSEFNWSAGEALEALAIVGDIFSSFRNAHAAYTWYRLQQVTDANGKRLFDIPEGDFSYIITKALGFTPGRTQDIYTAKEFNRSHTEDMRNVVNGLSQAYRLYLTGGISEGTYQAAREALLESLPTRILQQKAKEAFGKKVFDPKSEEQKVFQKALKNYLDSGSFTGSVIKNSSVGLTEEFGKEREDK